MKALPRRKAAQAALERNSREAKREVSLRTSLTAL
jgi:hypothetical protein